MLSDFRVEHGQALNDLLSEILAAMMAEGLVNCDPVSQSLPLRLRSGQALNAVKGRPAGAGECWGKFVSTRGAAQELARASPGAGQAPG